MNAGRKRKEQSEWNTRNTYRERKSKNYIAVVFSYDMILDLFPMYKSDDASFQSQNYCWAGRCSLLWKIPTGKSGLKSERKKHSPISSIKRRTFSESTHGTVFLLVILLTSKFISETAFRLICQVPRFERPVQGHYGNSKTHEDCWKVLQHALGQF